MTKAKSYVVGYGKPPKHGQFKPGKSGNPTGKKKDQRSLSSLLDEKLSQRISVTLNGKTREMTHREALLYGVINDAVRGRDRARKQLLDLMLLFEPAPEPEPEEILSPKEDRKIVDAFLERHGLTAGKRPKKTSKCKKLNKEAGSDNE